MNLQKYTEKAQEAVVQAQSLASEQNNSQIEPEHLLLALLTQEGGVVPQVLQRLGATVPSLTQQARAEIEKLPRVTGSAQQPYVSNRLNQVGSRAETEAKNIKDEYVSTEHLLLALIEEGG